MDCKTKENRYQELIKSLRFYKNELPKKDEYVYAHIKNFTTMGIECFLYEYKKDAFLSYKDASSSRKLKNIKKEVLKNKDYILTAINIDTHKGFIDVDKRSTDKDTEIKISSLILFYQKIFNIFLQKLVFKYPNKTVPEIYDFFDKTLWKVDPKEIKKNILTIHQDESLVKEKYNLNDDIGNEIIKSLLQIIPKPKIRQTIELKINSISICAVEDIQQFVIEIGKVLNTEFIIKAAPIYTAYIYKEYDSSVSNDYLKTYLENKINTFIKNYNKENLYVLLDKVSVDLMQESNSN